MPFPLRLEVCLPEIERLVGFVSGVLMDFGGIRRIDIIGKQLSENLKYLESGGWQRTLATLEKLRTNQTPEIEHEAVAFIDDNFTGYGPNQSRNLLQCLELTRYEIPISNRLLKWLNQNGFPIGISREMLADASNYDFVSTGIRKLCEYAEVFPYVFGAAFNAPFDKQAVLNLSD